MGDVIKSPEKDKLKKAFDSQCEVLVETFAGESFAGSVLCIEHDRVVLDPISSGELIPLPLDSIKEVRGIAYLDL